MTTAIPAGAELDNAVAHRVMGWERSVPPDIANHVANMMWWSRSADGFVLVHGRSTPDFSSDWGDAGAVVERMRELGWEWEIESFPVSPARGDFAAEPSSWRASLDDMDSNRPGPFDDAPVHDVSRDAPTAPEAVCRAALAALA